MALIKCPECGKKISDTSEVCIHCGYKLNDGANSLYESTFSSPKVSKPVVIAHRTRDGDATAAGVIIIIVGVFLVIAIVGIFLVILGIANINEGKTNNSNPHECAYYDPKTKKITLYSLQGDKFVVNPKDIEKISRPSGTNNLIVKVNIDGSTKKIDCGGCSKTGVNQFQEYVKQINGGTFDPSELSEQSI